MLDCIDIKRISEFYKKFISSNDEKFFYDGKEPKNEIIFFEQDSEGNGDINFVVRGEDNSLDSTNSFEINIKEGLEMEGDNFWNKIKRFKFQEVPLFDD